MRQIDEIIFIHSEGEIWTTSLWIVMILILQLLLPKMTEKSNQSINRTCTKVAT
jgi:hypothetical protein